MCIKIGELNGSKPKKFLKDKDLFELPIDIEKILLDNNVDLYDVDFSSLEKGLQIKNLQITGMAYAKEDDLRILLTNGLEIQERRFTLAHEFAHCCMHMLPTDSYHVEFRTNCDLLEVQNQKIKIINFSKEEADSFARELLIPKESLLHILNKRQDLTIEQLSELFLVPIKQMRKRMEEIFQEIKGGII